MGNFIGGSNGSPEQTYARQQLAAAITAKGVPTDPKASFNVMAEKVRLIQQETYELQGDKIYEQQMFGAETISPEPYKQNGPLWNLYKVMTDLLSDARFIGYGGILLAEYYKGYDTIELMNAGAGGAYFTCDGDFYTTDKAGDNAHVWHDGDNGMANRWVAYLFAAPGSNYTIPSENLCPRSIHIGRSVGTISCSIAGRIREIVVTDGNRLYATNFLSSQNWSPNVVLNNVDFITNDSILIKGNSQVESVVINGMKILKNSTIFQGEQTNLSFVDLKSIEEFPLLGAGRALFQSVTFPKLATLYFNKNASIVGYSTSLFYADAFRNGGEKDVLYINGLKNITTLCANHVQSPVYFTYKKLIMPDVESIEDLFYGNGQGVSIPYLTQILLPSTERINTLFSYTSKKAFEKLENIEVGNLKYNFNCASWNPTTVLSTPEGVAQINANIRDHIAAKVSDRTGQTALTFTISTNLYNNLEQATIDAFTAKNWNVAGA